MKVTKTRLKKLLGQELGCYIQHTGYPCRSCFHTIHIARLSEDIHEYWLAVLWKRGDYKDFDWGDTDVSKFPKLLEELCIELDYASKSLLKNKGE